MQGGECRLLFGKAGLRSAGLCLQLVVLLLCGGEVGGVLRLRVFKGKQGFGKGVVLGL